MNDQKEIKWNLRFKGLRSGRAFISDKRILLDEAYFPLGELEAATPEQMQKVNGILSTPISTWIDMKSLVPNGNCLDIPGGLRLATHCVNFLKTLSFRDRLRLAVAVAEDPFIQIFDGELLIGAMTPMKQPHELSEEGRRRHAKEFVAKIPATIIEKADEGEPVAFCLMAMFYGRAYEYCTDYDVECLKWTTLAAETGDACNQYMLACMYASGDVVSTDYTKALDWYQKAADQDYPDAFWRLGLMFSLGMGTDEDPVKALELVEKAIDLGAKRAPEIRTRMRRYISKNDVEAAHASLMKKLENKTQDTSRAL